ncbi:helix-turn-helix domain-containing protein [Plantactinospora sp. CA-294935]|uniref:helix-turn-helix domain-containing protein n=1 Tax=Plantactinospora sp. CA-294935 TaxID=3240012 RepID=UPI003D93EB86
MPDGTDDLDPGSARTPADLVGLLRQLRNRSGLSFRRIERLARAAGDNLPASTLATMLARNTLPREELVRALTRACGESPESVDRWLAARRRLVDAAATPPTTEPPEPEPAEPEPAEPEPAEPPEPADRRPRPGLLLLAAATGAVVAIAAVLAGWWLSRPADRDGTARPEPTVTNQSAPTGGDPGTQVAGGQGGTRIRVAHSGLCLSERPEFDDGQVFQASCAEAFPVRSLSAPITATGGGTSYLIQTDHPEFGLGCMGIREGSRKVGARVEDDHCGQEGAGEQFHLDPVGSPGQGFRLRLVHSGLCVTVDDIDAEWAELVQLPCDPGHTGQVFLVEPTPPDIRPAPLR